MNKRPRAACKNYWLVPEEPVPDDAGPEPPETSFLPLAELESLDVVAEPAPELTVPPVFEEMPLPDDMPLPIEPLEEPSLIAPGTLFLPLAALVPEALPPLLSVPPVVPVPPAAEVLLSADDVCANASAGASNVKAMAAARNFDLI